MRRSQWLPRQLTMPSRKARRGVFIALTAVALGAASACGSSGLSESDAAVGNCLKSTDKGQKTTAFAKVDCSAPDAAYKVAEKLNSTSCPTVYGQYSPAKRKSRSKWSACLSLNAKVGDCFHQEVGFPTGRAAKVACGREATSRWSTPQSPTTTPKGREGGCSPRASST